MADSEARTNASQLVAERDWWIQARVRIVRETTAHSLAWCSPRTFRVGEELTLHQGGQADAAVNCDSWRRSIDGEHGFTIPADCVEVIDVLQERPPTWDAAALTASQITELLAPRFAEAGEVVGVWESAGLHVAHEFGELVIRTPGPEYRRVGSIRRGYPDRDQFTGPYHAIEEDSPYPFSRRTRQLDALPTDPVAAAGITPAG
jgi:hypothetical protein